MVTLLFKKANLWYGISKSINRVFQPLSAGRPLRGLKIAPELLPPACLSIIRVARKAIFLWYRKVYSIYHCENCRLRLLPPACLSIIRVARKAIFLLLIGIMIFLSGLVAVGRAEEGVKDKKQLIQEAKEELNNTVWSIELRRMATQAGKKKEAETDTLRFENYRIESKKMVSEEFTPTNYSVRLKGAENEVIIWETMQTSEEKGLAFWRGEIRNDIMRGVLSWHLDEKEKEDYTFVSKEKEIIPEVTEEEVTPPAIQEIEQPKEVPAEAVKETAKEKPTKVETEEKKEETEEAKKKEPEAKQPVEEKNKIKKEKR